MVGPGVEVVAVPAAPDGLPLAAARNAGAEAALAAGADLLVFLDVDCLPGPDSARRRTPRRRPAPAAARAALRPGRLPAAAAARRLRPRPAGRPPVPPGPAGSRRRDRARPAATTRLFWSLSFALDRARPGGGSAASTRATSATAPRTPTSRMRADRDGHRRWSGSAVRPRSTSGTRPPPRRSSTSTTSSATAALFADRWGWWPMAGLAGPIRRPRPGPGGRSGRLAAATAGHACIRASSGGVAHADRPPRHMPPPDRGALRRVAWRRTPPWSPTSWSRAATRSRCSPRRAAAPGPRSAPARAGAEFSAPFAPPTTQVLDRARAPRASRSSSAGDFDVVLNNSLNRCPPAALNQHAMLTMLHTPATLDRVNAVVARPGWPPGARHGFAAVSEATAPDWQARLPGVDIDWSPTGSTSPLAPAPAPAHEPDLAVWAARITPEKGLPIAIAAAPGRRLPARHRRSDRRPGALRDARSPRCWATTSATSAISTTRELPGFLRRGAVFVSSPLWPEPFGLALVEAMACGTPAAAAPPRRGRRGRRARRRGAGLRHLDRRAWPQRSVAAAPARPGGVAAVSPDSARTPWSTPTRARLHALCDQSTTTDLLVNESVA